MSSRKNQYRKNAASLTVRTMGNPEYGIYKLGSGYYRLYKALLEPFFCRASFFCSLFSVFVSLKPKCYRDYNLCLGICILQNRPEELPDVIRVVVDKKDVVFLELLL